MPTCAATADAANATVRQTIFAWSMDCLFLVTNAIIACAAIISVLSKPSLLISAPSIPNAAVPHPIRGLCPPFGRS